MSATTARIDAVFAARLPLVEAAAAQHAGAMVRTITAVTRDAIRSIIVATTQGEMTPAQAARHIRDVVGLSTPQAAAVVSFRAGLVDLGLTPQVIDAKVERYATRLRRQRAKLIAQTEVQRALSDGQHEAWRQARAAGLISSSAQRRWLATGTGTKARLCPKCAALDGQTASLDGAFADGTERPPRHPGCRCTVALEV